MITPTTGMSSQKRLDQLCPASLKRRIATDKLGVSNAKVMRTMKGPLKSMLAGVCRKTTVSKMAATILARNTNRTNHQNSFRVALPVKLK